MARRSKPSVETRCVANNYAGPNERIVEVSSSGGGCLIAFTTGEDGKALRIDVYRADQTVTVRGPFYDEEGPAQR